MASGSSPAGLRFDPAGLKLAVYRDGALAVRILDRSGRPSGQPLSHPDRVTTTPAWHPDGERLLISYGVASESWIATVSAAEVEAFLDSVDRLPSGTPAGEAGE